MLIDEDTQNRIANEIDEAAEKVISAIASHGNEEGLTAALGQLLTRRAISEPDLRVEFNYRQHNKRTEEQYSGADGGFLVRVTTPTATVEKASLFQAKLLGGMEHVRDLSMTLPDARRLKSQTKSMLTHTQEAVAMFYTQRNIYVVDASDYSESPESKQPLSNDHRLITLGTYLGKWIPRCTKGDQRPELVTRVKHMDGFKNMLTMNVISNRPSVTWNADHAEDAWRHKG